MRRRASDDKEVDQVAVALLAGERKKQTEIAESLGLSQAAVSRLLAQARRHYLREEVSFLRDNVPDDLLKKALQRVDIKDLANHVDDFARQNGQKRGPVLRVFSGGKPSDDNPTRIAEFSRNAAPFIRSLILRSRICGVAWGQMLNGVVSALRSLQLPPPWSIETIQCIPLSGEPLGNLPVSFSSSSLAHNLGNIINGDEYRAPSMAMVPAFIPDGFELAEVKGVRKLIGLVKSYDSIFGVNGMVERLDMILTSVAADRPLGFGAGRLFETGTVSIDRLQELVLGDIGGVCIPKPGLGKREKEEIASVTRRWTGLREEHLRQCVDRIQDPSNGAPGVVLVSGGRGRAGIIASLIRQGLVNHLIIDDIVAKELEPVVKQIEAGKLIANSPVRDDVPGGSHGFLAKTRRK